MGCWRWDVQCMLPPLTTSNPQPLPHHHPVLPHCLLVFASLSLASIRSLPAHTPSPSFAGSTPNQSVYYTSFKPRLIYISLPSYRILHPFLVLKTFSQPYSFASSFHSFPSHLLYLHFSSIFSHLLSVCITFLPPFAPPV